MKGRECAPITFSKMCLILALGVAACSADSEPPSQERRAVGLRLNPTGEVLIAVGRDSGGAAGIVDLYIFAPELPVAENRVMGLFPAQHASAVEYSQNRLSLVSPEGKRHDFTVGGTTNTRGEASVLMGRAIARYEAFSIGPVEECLSKAAAIGLNLQMPAPSNAMLGGRVPTAVG